MLSVLIPVYAYDVRPFVRALQAQALLLSIDWEIILFDDGSPQAFKNLNKELHKLEGIQYKELNENIGRAAIRNALAQAAQFEYLLFMDCDSAVTSPLFLQNYCENLSPNTVLCGGRSYTIEPPKNKTWLLHWQYGKQREVRTADERQKQAYHGFMTNNFVIPKNVFISIQLDGRLKQYGHEDTLLGLKLEQADIPIIHIENPLLHIGLDAGKDWLCKQQQAIQNLFWLHQENPTLVTPALKTWRFIRKIGLMILFYPILKQKEAVIKKNLIQKNNPRLWTFNLLKILWLEESKRGL